MTSLKPLAEGLEEASCLTCDEELIRFRGDEAGAGVSLVASDSDSESSTIFLLAPDKGVRKSNLVRHLLGGIGSKLRRSFKNHLYVPPVINLDLRTFAPRVCLLVDLGVFIPDSESDEAASNAAGGGLFSFFF